MEQKDKQTIDACAQLLRRTFGNMSNGAAEIVVAGVVAILENL